MADGGDVTAEPPADTAGEGEVYVLGTAHVSERSVDEVEETIERERPDVVAVELDEGRYRQMQGGTPDDIEAKDLLSGNTVFQFLAYWMLSYVQSRLGERFGIEPGADMRAAIDTAERHGMTVALVDRDIQITIQRFWARLTFAEKLKMVGGLAMGFTNPIAIGITLGATVGGMIGLLGSVIFAPWIGVDAAAMIGLEGSTAVQLIGAVIVGALVGFLVALVFFPSFNAGEPGERTGSTLRIVGGVSLGIGVSLLLVTTETFVGPISAGTFDRAGTLTARGSLGLIAGIGIGSLIGLGIGAFLNLFTADVDEIELVDIEEMTDGDVVAALLEEFRRFSPHGANTLIDERDAYIAHKLHALRDHGYHVVAVVGAGHKAGIERYLEAPETLPPMSELTGTHSRRLISPVKVIGYGIMVAIVGFFFLLLMAGVQNTFLLQLFLAWFLFNGVFAFTMARLAGARWTSAGVGGSVAWLTSINPLLAPGWFAGYVELRYRPVNVADIQTLNEIISDTERTFENAIRDMFDVPMFRLIMIVALTNVGSMIATFLFPVVVLPWLAPEIGGIDGLMGELITGAENSVEAIHTFIEAIIGLIS